jgi:hypothetical protein
VRRHPDDGREVEEVDARLHLLGVGDDDVHAGRHLLLHPALALVGRGAQDGRLEARLGQHALPLRLDVQGVGLQAEEEHLAALRFLLQDEVDDGLFFGAAELLRQAGDGGDHPAAARAAHDLGPPRRVGPEEQGVQVAGQQRLVAAHQPLDQLGLEVGLERLVEQRLLGAMGTSTGISLYSGRGKPMSPRERKTERLRSQGSIAGLPPGSSL